MSEVVKVLISSAGGVLDHRRDDRLANVVDPVFKKLTDFLCHLLLLNCFAVVLLFLSCEVFAQTLWIARSESVLKAISVRLGFGYETQYSPRLRRMVVSTLSIKMSLMVDPSYPSATLHDLAYKSSVYSMKVMLVGWM